jgi:predicted nucleotidyltransferase
MSIKFNLVHLVMISTYQEKIIKDTITPYKPGLVGVFGSYARNENNTESDLDILVDLNDEINLLDIIGIEQTLEDKLGIKVDLVTLRSVKPELKNYIEKDLIRLV